jgi:hypothetical protein
LEQIYIIWFQDMGQKRVEEDFALSLRIIFHRQRLSNWLGWIGDVEFASVDL